MRTYQTSSLGNMYRSGVDIFLNISKVWKSSIFWRKNSNGTFLAISSTWSSSILVLFVGSIPEDEKWKWIFRQRVWYSSQFPVFASKLFCILWEGEIRRRQAFFKDLLSRIRGKYEKWPNSFLHGHIIFLKLPCHLHVKRNITFSAAADLKHCPIALLKRPPKFKNHD